MKKKKTSMIVAAVLILLIAAAAVLTVAKTVKADSLRKAFAEQMSLGERYLLEQNYEEAVIAFQMAIEIDPKNADSYLKLSEAYAGVGDYENAVSALEKGYVQTQNEHLTEAREKYQLLLEQIPVLQRLAEVMSQVDRDAVWEFQKGDEYQDMVDLADEVITYPVDDKKYLLIYPCGHCYYGTMKDGKRWGHGIWAAYDYSSELSSYYDGEWTEDYPGGEGRYWTMCLPVPEDLFYDEGTWADGLENGRISSTYISTYGGETYTDQTSHTSKNGIPEEVSDLHPEKKHIAKGKEFYCMYSDGEKSEYAIKGKTYGIVHAGKGVDDNKSMVSGDVEE